MKSELIRYGHSVDLEKQFFCKENGNGDEGSQVL